MAGQTTGQLIEGRRGGLPACIERGSSTPAARAGVGGWLIHGYAVGKGWLSLMSRPKGVVILRCDK